MNLLKLSFLLVLAVTFTACGSDDDSEPVCVQSDWVGTYSGTVDCDGTVEDVTVTITASGADAIVIKHETSTVETEFDPLTPTGCDLDRTASSGGFTVTVDATLDDDKLSFVEILTDGNTTTTCTITATRD